MKGAILSKARIKTPTNRPKSGFVKRIKEDSAGMKEKEKSDTHVKTARHRKDSHKEKHPDQQHDGHHKGHEGHPKSGHEGHQRTGHHGDTHHPHPSHPIRPRAGTLTHKDTAHSIASSKGHKHGTKDHDRHSVATSGDFQLEVKYENTYKMQPDAKYREAPIRQIIADVIKENLNEKAYDPAVLSGKCRLASDIIKERVKHLDISRYKIVTSIIVTQKADQGMTFSSRCLWDHKNDNVISVKVEQGEYFIVGTVFVVYAE
ncbi:hypothetical protein FSP39_022190 [Pinctada imbricata]|uniref:Uncharacterized protein n=1 Tax=Pinctada imbricata TaxID=66713 RepID=A0AA88Y932_PINIB|nr:hypothetical protein FSP39_022190 [Pinctada imbricata]